MVCRTNGALEYCIVTISHYPTSLHLNCKNMKLQKNYNLVTFVL